MKKFLKKHRYWLLRRLTQFTILGLFMLGAMGKSKILTGNYSGSLLFERIPLTDPLITLQSFASGYVPLWQSLLGTLLVGTVYVLIGSRVFCGWVCPMNLVTDFAFWCRQKLGIRQQGKLSRSWRYGLLFGILVGTLLSGSMFWVWIDPVASLGRGIIYGVTASLWTTLAIFLFDLFVIERGWCGHLCPLGALYGVIGAKGILRVKVKDREKCTRCMDCFKVCPEQEILRLPLLGKKEDATMVLSQDCTTCGQCIEICEENVLCFASRFQLKHKE